MKIKLDVCLIFDANEAWSSTENFESDYANYLLSKGLIGEKVQTSDDDSKYDLTIAVSKQKQEAMLEEKIKSPAAQKRDIKFNLSRPQNA